MEIPNNPTLHIHYEPVEPGTTAKPTLTDYAYGPKEDSRICDAKEGIFFTNTANIIALKK